MGLALSPTGDFYDTPLALLAKEAALACDDLLALLPSRAAGAPGRLDLLLPDLVNDVNNTTVKEMADALPLAITVRPVPCPAARELGGKLGPHATAPHPKPWRELPMTSHAGVPQGTCRV